MVTAGDIANSTFLPFWRLKSHDVWNSYYALLPTMLLQMYLYFHDQILKQYM